MNVVTRQCCTNLIPRITGTQNHCSSSVNKDTFIHCRSPWFWVYSNSSSESQSCNKTQTKAWLTLITNIIISYLTHKLLKVVGIQMAVVSDQALYNHTDISDSSPISLCHHSTAFQPEHTTDHTMWHWDTQTLCITSEKNCGPAQLHYAATPSQLLTVCGNCAAVSRGIYFVVCTMHCIAALYRL